MKKHHVSFKHAWHGIYHNLSTQPNFRIHLVAAALVTLAGVYFSIQPWEWIILAFTIILVLVTEMINTTIESMVDLITTEHRQQAKIAKDTSAGMVLVTAIASLIIALLIFVPHLT